MWWKEGKDAASWARSIIILVFMDAYKYVHYFYILCSKSCSVW